MILQSFKCSEAKVVEFFNSLEKQGRGRAFLQVTVNSRMGFL